MHSNILLISFVASSLIFSYGNAGDTTFYGIQGEGHPLIIKTIPAIDNVQSELYEVYMEPYAYRDGKARALSNKDKQTKSLAQDLRPKSGVAVVNGEGVSGEITFFQKQPPVGLVVISGKITGLTAGKHGIHIHQAGDLRNGCGELGEHFDPFLLQHGGPTDTLRHVGDLGNIEAKEDGSAEFTLEDSFISLSGGPRSILGRGIVITEKEDDLGKGGSAESVRNGSAGRPIACGVIAVVR